MSNNLPDFEKYDDEKLEAARVAVVTELERRAWSTSIPAQVQQLAAQYVEGGGDLADLTLEQRAVPTPGPLKVDQTAAD